MLHIYCRLLENIPGDLDPLVENQGEEQAKFMSKFTSLPRGVAAAAKSLRSCPTLCDSIDGSPPGSPIPGILQGQEEPGGLQSMGLQRVGHN